MQQSAIGGWKKFRGNRVLLLQGPHGTFFRRIEQVLISAGVLSLHKINFNGGDRLFSTLNAHDYRGSMQDWPEYLAKFIKSHQIDCVMVFGDCRPIHQAAREVAIGQGIQFWTFEEGYIRPNFITLEQHGVNGNSKLPTDRNSYERWQLRELPLERSVPPSFWRVTGFSIAYFAATILMRWRYPHYQHHRPVRVMDGLYWLRALGRKWYYSWKERSALADLNGHGGTRPFFLSILQVALDAQVREHSKFASIPQYIDETVRSFARCAPEETVLLIKHHPLDRGYSDYSRLIAQLTIELGLQGRLRYIHDQHLPTVMAHAKGLVTINSTVGLSAMDHDLPVKTLGQAVYDIPGLTSQRELDDFWQLADMDKPDTVLHEKFVNYVIAHTQLNGNFYRELPDAGIAGLHYNDDPEARDSPLFSCLNQLGENSSHRLDAGTSSRTSPDSESACKADH
ncbi:capsular biosynthesis protein [Variovorax sp. PCZ-1]|uniref:capsule biosynthesis protein n=1 Tax=Variovorax sp. PCZ-1 TaxID=2835533 RepID=UPI001BCEE695|nr:capsular biosynthesis protein [Variovorax sp. PCZ-1]MBS7807666.1 capsular biosynthesis protein [Variovorax sp. PCZ-1]